MFFYVLTIGPTTKGISPLPHIRPKCSYQLLITILITKLRNGERLNGLKGHVPYQGGSPPPAKQKVDFFRFSVM